MVRTVDLHICEVCGKEGKDKQAIKEHEQTPITGLDLEIGAMFKFHPEHYQEKDHVVVIFGSNILKSHMIEYWGEQYMLVPSYHGEKPYTEITRLEILYPRRISELTDTEYESAKEILGEGVTEIARRRSIRPFELSKGVIKEL